MNPMKCPLCAEEIQAEAKKCKHCGEFLNGSRVRAAAALDTPQLFRLKEGTRVALRVSDTVSSATSITGDRFSLALQEDLRDGNFVFAKAGARAVGSVSHAKKAGMLGKGGELNVRIEHLKIGGSRVPLRGTSAREGASKGVGSWFIWGAFNLVRKGKNVEIPAGTVTTAYVDDDVMLPATEQKQFCTECGREIVWPDQLCSVCASSKPTTADKRKTLSVVLALVLVAAIVIALLVVASLSNVRAPNETGGGTNNRGQGSAASTGPIESRAEFKQMITAQHLAEARHLIVDTASFDEFKLAGKHLEAVLAVDSHNREAARLQYKALKL